MKPQKKESQNAFWSQLDHDIDAIGRRAKYNLKKYEQQQSQTMKGFRSNRKPKLSVPKSKTIAVYNNKNFLNFDAENMKRTQIFKAKREEQKMQKQIKNRLIYISQQKEKKSHALDQLKKKYEKLIEVRKSSFKQKQYLRKKRKSFEKESQKSISSKVQSVRSSRRVRDESVKNWKRQVQSSAKQLRKETKSNESLIHKQKQFNIKENKKKAQKARINFENNRSRLSEISGKRRQLAHINFMEERSKQLSNLQSRRKNNKKLLEKLKSESQRISNYKVKAEWELENYRSFMGVSPKKKESRIFSSYGSSQSFYVTAS